MVLWTLNRQAKIFSYINLNIFRNNVLVVPHEMFSEQWAWFLDNQNLIFWALNQFDLKHETLLIKSLLNIEIWYIKIHDPRPLWHLKITGNVIFFVKIFSLKQKPNQIFLATIEKVRFRLFKKIDSC